MRKWIISVSIAFLILGFVGNYLWKASKPVFLASYLGMGWSEHDGTSDTYRELGGFSASRWKYRQWFEIHDLITMSGCIVADQPGTKAGVGGSKIGANAAGRGVAKVCYYVRYQGSFWNSRMACSCLTGRNAVSGDF